MKDGEINADNEEKITLLFAQRPEYFRECSQKITLFTLGGGGRASGLSGFFVTAAHPLSRLFRRAGVAFRRHDIIEAPIRGVIQWRLRTALPAGKIRP